MSGKVLPNVPRIAQFVDDMSYLTPWIGSLYAALHALGAPRDYAELLALSGAGNRMCWEPGTWNGGNVDILSYDDPPFAPHERTLRALGMRADIRPCAAIDGVFTGGYVDEATARREIVASIDAGIPVVAMGVLGPPECCVVFGYEDGGDKLVGWNYFQGDFGFDVMRPFAKDAWFAGTHGYILLKHGADAPPQRDSAVTMFRAIVETARRAEMVRGRLTGFAAWEQMLYQLEQDDFSRCTLMLPQGDWEGDMWSGTVQGRFFTYCDALCEVHERGVTLPYLRTLRSAYPEWDKPLAAAIEALEVCSRYGGFLWKHVSMDERGYEKFRTPEIRKILADEGRSAMAKDREAVEAFEALLAQEGA